MQIYLWIKRTKSKWISNLWSNRINGLYTVIEKIYFNRPKFLENFIWFIGNSSSWDFGKKNSNIKFLMFVMNLQIRNHRFFNSFLSFWYYSLLILKTKHYYTSQKNSKSLAHYAVVLSATLEDARIKLFSS